MSAVIVLLGAADSDAIAALGLAPGLMTQPAIRTLGLRLETGDVIAALMLQIAADEAEIVDIAVAPSHRRKGHAQTLIAHAVASLPRDGVRVLHLEVDEANTGARALYAASGFVETGRRAAYYRRPDGTRGDAVLMRLALDGETANA
ncbi:MAG: GNAT family N-acetyltransferase [Rhodobiaceae bacterium]|nr:GNAT family N-acetyltransferase [Rhodobiaceae bacterium]